ncbi:hypothetical protein DQ04_12401010 [Trypanosoma grayi]|uniref:hypothetical protein n=1 Tax=Trypanosoma grayi TaxID=71804 RepID=UPI0004F48EB8|nr:hypothetical protein DQ04_12401010 [Trypanosoma grayi]KEG06757.1 hypothetical protein DQ04_12401010 [Trypanosoma grayi]
MNVPLAFPQCTMSSQQPLSRMPYPITSLCGHRRRSTPVPARTGDDGCSQTPSAQRVSQRPPVPCASTEAPTHSSLLHGRHTRSGCDLYEAKSSTTPFANL